jgi:RNA polymerase sigma-70 factor (ECF subfamily)
MDDRRKRLVWDIILGHEADIRRWLMRRLKNPADVEDIIQEAYCRFWALPDVGAIAHPRAYFFRMVRNIAIDQMRSAAALPIEGRGDIAKLSAASDEAGPERVISAREELTRVRKLLAALPPRCRTVLIMRKIYGIPQREIAARLGITESTVENDVGRGLKAILKAMARGKPGR